MTNIMAISILENEIKCVKRANQCNRDCANCDLILKDSEIINAYEKAIHSLKYNTKHKKAYKRFKDKYVILKYTIQKAINEICDTADADAYSDYDVGVNYGLMLAFKILRRYLMGIK